MRSYRRMAAIAMDEKEDIADRPSGDVMVNGP
jgi:hypothetical protein